MRYNFLLLLVICCLNAYGQSETQIWLSEEMIDKTIGTTTSFNSRFEISRVHLIWFQGAQEIKFVIEANSWNWDTENHSGEITFELGGLYDGTIKFFKSGNNGTVNLKLIEEDLIEEYIFPVTGFYIKE